MGSAEVEVFEGSVLAVRAEAVVNAANTELRHGGGLAAAIARAAGPAFQEESRAVAPCALGGAVATGAGRIAAKVVIHVPTVDYRMGARVATPEQLCSGVAAALRLARQQGCASAAFPILGAGIAGLDAVDACGAMAQGFVAAERSGAGTVRVIVCAFSERDRAAARQVFGRPAPGRGAGPGAVEVGPDPS